MLPAQRNKVDISKLTPAEQQAFRLYGKLPSRSVSKSQERKYFDSGDWALSKAGKQKGEYGKEIPTPDAIPHASPSPLVGGSINANNGSPGIGGASSPGSLGGINTGIASGSPPGSFSLGANAAGGPSPTATSGGPSALSQAAPGHVSSGGTGTGTGTGTGNSSPPASASLATSGPISPGSNLNSGIISNNSNSNANSQVSPAGSSAVSLSMSPGRVGIGGSMGVPISIGSPGSAHALATSPTRSFGSFPIAHSHTHSTHHHSYSNSNNNNNTSNTVGSASNSVGVGAPLSPPAGLSIPLPGSSTGGLASSLSGTSPMISATTGNQVGKVQIRRASQSSDNNNHGNTYGQASGALPDIGGVSHAVNMANNTGTILGGTASPPPTSGLANSITPDSLMEDEDDDNADEEPSREATPGNTNKGEDEQVEGMELQ